MPTESYAGDPLSEVVLPTGVDECLNSPPLTPPAGDQPEAIEKLAASIEAGNRYQNPARRHGIWQDPHHGQNHRKDPAPHPDHDPQQNLSRSALQ